MRKITDLIKLQEKALELKVNVIRMLDKADAGHVGGAFSMTDLMVALYYNIAKVDPENPDWKLRDYILVSNGHTCPIWYAILADLGFFPKEELQHLRQIDHMLQGHPLLGIPGVENSSGPLGHGLSQAVGIALGLQMDHRKNRVFCFLSDSEHQEGQTWEAIMSAAKWELDNLVAIVDHNGVQIEGWNYQIMPLGDLKAKYQSFGWRVLTCNGHDYDDLLAAYEHAMTLEFPAVIIAETVSGKDVSFMENKYLYHDWKDDSKLTHQALFDLERKIKELRKL